MRDDARLLRRLVRALERVDTCAEEPGSSCYIELRDMSDDNHGRELERAYRAAKRHVDALDAAAKKRPN